MRIGYIILCRYNSTRLPGKVLMQINNKPILQHIIEKLLLIAESRNIVVTTSIEKTDDPIEDYCNENELNVFRGDLDNVAKRFLDCAVHFAFDFAARINGDNIFVDPQIIINMLAKVQTNKFDFVSNVKDRTFPKGMSVEIVRVSHYQKLYAKFQSPEDFEHVTYYLYRNDNIKKHYYYYNIYCPEAAGIQLAIDTKDDLEFARNIFKKYFQEKMKYNLKDIYQFYKYEQNE